MQGLQFRAIVEAAIGSRVSSLSRNITISCCASGHASLSAASIARKENSADSVRKAFDHPPRIVCRTIVDNYDLTSRMILRQCTLYRKRDELRVVVTRNDEH